MFTIVQSVALRGLQGFRVGVEADLGQGLPGFDIVGLPTSSVREAKERVRSAIENSGYTWPRKRIIINLTPSDWRKDGTGLDFPIAVAILAASEQIPPVSADFALLGELALDGSIRSFRGIWTAVHRAAELGARHIMTPIASDLPHTIRQETDILPMPSLAVALCALRGEYTPLLQVQATLSSPLSAWEGPDLAEVAGQTISKRALEIAAAGRHHIILTGPPGSGKSMLAERLPSLLPPLSSEEWTEVRQIYSVAGVDSGVGRPPFRSPHYTLSPAGMLGGGITPTPGEVSLAHRGVLFLDEFPEFTRSVLEGLRQPLEQKSVTVSRSLYHCTFPADFQLIAAMNPCPCGYLGSTGTIPCSCEQKQVERYRSKLSGPILDRMDMSVWVDATPLRSLTQNASVEWEPSSKIRERVMQARSFSEERRRSAEPSATGLGKSPAAALLRLTLSAKAESLLLTTAEVSSLSARSMIKVARLARTIADLSGLETVEVHHMAEAMQYRFYH